MDEIIQGDRELNLVCCTFTWCHLFISNFRMKFEIFLEFDSGLFLESKRVDGLFRNLLLFFMQQVKQSL